MVGTGSQITHVVPRRGLADCRARFISPTIPRRAGGCTHSAIDWPPSDTAKRFCAASAAHRYSRRRPSHSGVVMRAFAVPVTSAEQRCHWRCPDPSTAKLSPGGRAPQYQGGRNLASASGSADRAWSNRGRRPTATARRGGALSIARRVQNNVPSTRGAVRADGL